MTTQRFNQETIDSIRAEYTFHGAMNLDALASKYSVDRSTIFSVIHRRGTYSRELCSHCGSLKPMKA